MEKSKRLPQAEQKRARVNKGIKYLRLMHKK